MFNQTVLDLLEEALGFTWPTEPLYTDEERQGCNDLIDVSVSREQGKKLFYYLVKQVLYCFKYLQKNC